MAWQAYQRDLCDGCGQSLSASTAKENTFSYGAEVVRCHACERQQRVGQDFAKQDDKEGRGVLVRLSRTPE